MGEIGRDGYGYKIDCDSALGLFGLLGLLELLRDTIVDITDQRKRRSIKRFKNEVNVQQINQFLPTVLPLIIYLSDLNDDEASVDCLEFMFCKSSEGIVYSYRNSAKNNENFASKKLNLTKNILNFKTINNANKKNNLYQNSTKKEKLKENYENLSVNENRSNLGVKKIKKISKLLTAVLAKAFLILPQKTTGGHRNLYKEAIIASNLGRKGAECSNLFKTKCEKYFYTYL